MNQKQLVKLILATWILIASWNEAKKNIKQKLPVLVYVNFFGWWFNKVEI